MFSVGFFAFCSQRWRAVGFWKGWGSEHVQRRGGTSAKTGWTSAKTRRDVNKDGEDVGKDGADVSVLRANFSLCRSLR